MSNVEQGENHATMQQLKEEIRRLREQQSAAEKMAGFVGMTTEESERYRERNNRIKRLTSQLAVLDSAEEVALHEQNEMEAIARPSVDEADELYREIRVENVLTDENGKKVRLKLGADVDVVVEADTDATTKKPD